MTEWMMDTVIVTCALTALVLLIRRPVAQIFGPTVAYGLWLLPAARVIMPSLEREIAAAAATPVSNASAILYAAVTDAPAAGRATAPFSEAAGLPQVDWIQIAVSLWLGIAALIFVIQMLRYVAMREVLLADAHNLGKVGSVRLIESDQVSGPLAFGLLDRYIAVPLNFNAVFPPEEREMALAHEMAHHRSGDLFANLAAFSLLSLTWFNPLSWLAWQAFRFDQEAACDARVLAGKDAAAKHVYGRALARTAHDRLPTFATALNTPRTIIARLKNLTMQDVSQRRRALGKVVIVTAIAVIVPLTATIVPVLAQNDGKNGAPTAISTAEMTTGHDTGGKPKYVITVNRDGDTTVIRTDKKLTDDEINKVVDRATLARKNADAAKVNADNALAAADTAMANADSATADADTATTNADTATANADAAAGAAARARSSAREARQQVVIIRKGDRINAVTSDRTAMANAGGIMDGEFLANMVPEIKILEVTRNCHFGQPVSTEVSGFDGKQRAQVRLVMCGKGTAKNAKAHALTGLREARSEIDGDEHMPGDTRAKVLKEIDRSIQQIEREQRAAG